MSQLILQNNDYVKYFRENQELTELGFIKGQLYQVYQEKDRLLIQSKLGYHGKECLVISGHLTDACNYFTKVVCPVIRDMPVGPEN